MPLLDHKVEADYYYQKPNWYKGHTAVDVLETGRTQCPEMLEISFAMWDLTTETHSLR